MSWCHTWARSLKYNADLRIVEEESPAAADRTAAVAEGKSCGDKPDRAKARLRLMIKQRFDFFSQTKK